MPFLDKLFWAFAALFLVVIVCVANKRACFPAVCDVCTFLTGEYGDFKDRIPDEFPD